MSNQITERETYLTLHCGREQSFGALVTVSAENPMRDINKKVINVAAFKS